MAISLEDVVLTRGPQILVDGLSTVVGDDSCVGIFGPNGCGKSTLLQAIRGEIPLESGHITFSPTAVTVGYVPQLRELPEDWTINEVLRDRTGAAEAERQLTAAARRLETDSSTQAADAFNSALNRFVALGVDSLEDRAPTVLADLDCDLTPDRLCAGLSGGELARIGLAGILLSQYDVLLLDEPTNDLDEAGVRCLTDFVTSRTTPVMLVSHDRRFLKSTITAVLEFDPALERVTRFDGGYRAWQREREQNRIAVVEANERYQQQVASLRSQAIATRQRAAAGTRSANRAYELGKADKLQRGAMLEGASAHGSAVRGIERKLDSLPMPDQVRKVWSLHLDFPAPAHVGGTFTLDEVVVGRGDFELGPISVSISPGQRIRINGPNGSGKSMLVEVLADAVQPVRGRVSTPARSDVGLLDQGRSIVPRQERSLAQWFPTASRLTPVESRTLLAKFGLGGEDVTRAMSTLSPGERTRVGLALLSSREHSALILDEPTNHLDLLAIEQLEQALARYRGTLIVVTHDEEFGNHLRFDQTINLARH